ncbi:GGDEF domain-containing protein [Shewanella algae]|uniref:GGDEF domain-containing protein n=1 Tax=Shewanella algae TaxID=38313 RepID=UPI0011837799|nr:GGDEF domain-containing protein [Shewanella algae]QXP20019.1 GGDEF domain-containing protein [Shewanella algae]QXP29659.1 GGDEF domain-containing protein [Shewanella algae]QXP33350.1 GGDEF domain-containing protein [Shewanella algae]QXP38821.1 GGDEF domain-containing protein [Shewanella algae]
MIIHAPAVSRLFATRLQDTDPMWQISQECQAGQLLSCLLATAATSLFFMLLYLWLFKSDAVVVINLLGLAAHVAIVADLWFYGNLRRSQWLTVLVPTCIALLMSLLLGTQHQITLYLLLSPILAFLLLGRSRGLLLSLGLASCIWLMLTLNQNLWQGADSLAGLGVVNFFAAYTMAVGIGYTGERIRHRSFKRLEKLANTDPLTGAMNRRRFFENWRRAKAEANRGLSEFAFLLLDIDYFKATNDSYGHDCGDAVLQQLVQLLEDRLRPYDLLGRLGGEEFGLLLRGVSAADAERKAEEIRAKVAEHNFGDEQVPHLPITVSIGIVHMPRRHGRSIESLYKQADMQLYHAKRAGRNQVVLADKFFEPA